QDTLQRPTTMYGVNKVAGELLCDYYHERFGVDTRGVRFPGLISYVTPPGGGTTDYAVDIYHEAIKKGSYTSNIDEGTYMGMSYLPDVLNAIIQLMRADAARLKHRNGLNVGAISAPPGALAAASRKHLPELKLDYAVDPTKRNIAESWQAATGSTAAKE